MHSTHTYCIPLVLKSHVPIVYKRIRLHEYIKRSYNKTFSCILLIVKSKKHAYNVRSAVLSLSLSAVCSLIWFWSRDFYTVAFSYRESVAFSACLNADEKCSIKNDGYFSVKLGLFLVLDCCLVGLVIFCFFLLTQRPLTFTLYC